MPLFHSVAVSGVVVAGWLGGALGVAPTAASDPGSAALEQQYLSNLYIYVHPPVTATRLIELGNLTCTVRRSGASTDDAKNAVWQNLDHQGMVSSNAEMGTLVHVAIDNLCPEVGYP